MQKDQTRGRELLKVSSEHNKMREIETIVKFKNTKERSRIPDKNICL